MDRIADADALAKRMYETAVHYLRGEQRLASGFADFGTAPMVLRFLALEILLKAVYVSSARTLPRRRHELHAIWRSLPEQVTTDILCQAKERMGPHADLNVLSDIFKDLESAFTKGRYHYEVDAHLDDEGRRRRTEEWIANGAYDEDADFRFHPMESDALIYGCAAYLQSALDLPKQDVLSA